MLADSRRGMFVRTHSQRTIYRRCGMCQSVFCAYEATNLSIKLYDSEHAGFQATMDYAEKFSIPLVANGKVHIVGETL